MPTNSTPGFSDLSTALLSETVLIEEFLYNVFGLLIFCLYKKRMIEWKARNELSIQIEIKSLAIICKYDKKKTRNNEYPITIVEVRMMNSPRFQTVKRHHGHFLTFVFSRLRFTQRSSVERKKKCFIQNEKNQTNFNTKPTNCIHMNKSLFCLEQSCTYQS